MSDARRTVVLRVRPGTSPRRAAELLRWMRWMLPAALLVVTQAAPPALPDPDDEDVVSIDADDEDVVSIDADEVDSGPLSLADALARRAHH